MQVFLTSDSYWEARVGQVLDSLLDAGCRQYFQDRDYGPGMSRLGIVIVCQDSALGLRQRIRYSKREKSLSMDLMLDLVAMKSADAPERKRIVAAHLYADIPPIVAKYEKVGFDSKTFVLDWQAWITALGWLQASE